MIKSTNVLSAYIITNKRWNGADKMEI